VLYLQRNLGLPLRPIHHLCLRAEHGRSRFSSKSIFVGPTFSAHCVDRAQWLHPARGDAASTPRGEPMRAEVQNVVDEIKQSVGLLRRHL
jgi:hypothetical protein